MQSPEAYERRAERSEALADQVSSPGVKRQLLKVAAEWRELAGLARREGPLPFLSWPGSEDG
jgi:hypothetical protein